MDDVNENESLFAAASYLGLFVTGIIFLMLEKDSKFVRFHAMQSIILFGMIFVLIYSLSYFPVLGWIMDLMLFLSGIILWIALMWKAFQGTYYKLPIIGNLAEKQLKRIESFK